MHVNGRLSIKNDISSLKMTIAHESRKIKSGLNIEYLEKRICFWGLNTTKETTQVFFKIRHDLHKIFSKLMLYTHRNVSRILQPRSGDYFIDIFSKGTCLAVSMNEPSYSKSLHLGRTCITRQPAFQK